jgi:protein-disulfide isomerase
MGSRYNDGCLGSANDDHNGDQEGRLKSSITGTAKSPCGTRKFSPRLAGWAAVGALGAGALYLGTGSPLAAQARLKRAHFARAAETLPAPVKAYGSKSAPIQMEVFTDYECPMCRNLYEQTLRPMIGDYVASGKVYLVHHDYPLDNLEHKYSGQAARWANVAAQVGEFEAAEGALYDNQQGWSADGNIAKYMAASMPGSDFRRIDKVMDTCEAPGPKGRPGGVALPPHPCEVDRYIEQDIQLGNQVPVTGTPTYVITYKGQRLPPGSGFVSWPVLKQFFDNLLRQ